MPKGQVPQEAHIQDLRPSGVVDPLADFNCDDARADLFEAQEVFRKAEIQLPLEKELSFVVELLLVCRTGVEARLLALSVWDLRATALFYIHMKIPCSAFVL